MGVPLYGDAPRIVIWETTRACALACRHCRAKAIPHRNPHELATKEAYALIDQIAEIRPPVFVLTGGDPLMRPDLAEIVRYAAERGLRVAISPSGTGRLTARALAELSAAGCRRLSLSIDGPDAETHDAFRGVQGTFARTLRAAEEAVEIGIELQINTTIARHNQDKIPEMAALVAHTGAKVWTAFFLVPTGRAQIEECLGAAEHEAAFAELFEISQRADFAVKTTEAPHFRRYVAQRVGSDGRPGIGDGRGFVFISHVGEIQPSGFLPITAGNVRTDRLLDVYRNDPVMRRLRDPDGFGGKCGTCEFRTLCGGSRARAYGFTGDPFAAEPCCVYTGGEAA